MIEPTGDKKKRYFDDFEAQGTELCNYTWSYKAFYEDIEVEDSEISNIVKLDSDKRKFVFQTTLPDMRYKIKLKGTLSDEITTAETTFKLRVKPLVTQYTV